MSIAQKLQKVLEIKNNIKQALINKGVDVSGGFEDFAEKIENIQSGEGSTPNSMAGLCLWLDGEINSRQGINDKSVNGMQNLVYSPYVGKTTTVGSLEKLNGTPVFSDKGIKLGGTCFYPAYSFDDVTIELCAQFGTSPNSDGQHWAFCNGNIGVNGRTCLIIDPNNIGFYALKSGNNVKTILTPYNQNQKVHYTITTKLTGSNNTKTYINGQQVQSDVVSDTASVVLSASNYNTSFGGISSTGTTSIAYSTANAYVDGAFWCVNDIFYSFRLWTRQLTDKEIRANYQEAKTRFGV